jgi:hypothetical protein
MGVVDQKNDGRASCEIGNESPESAEQARARRFCSRRSAIYSRHAPKERGEVVEKATAQRGDLVAAERAQMSLECLCPDPE